MYCSLVLGQIDDSTFGRRPSLNPHKCPLDPHNCPLPASPWCRPWPARLLTPAGQHWLQRQARRAYDEGAAAAIDAAPGPGAAALPGSISGEAGRPVLRGVC
jgi:hypothetical protein